LEGADIAFIGHIESWTITKKTCLVWTGAEKDSAVQSRGDRGYIVPCDPAGVMSIDSYWITRFDLAEVAWKAQTLRYRPHRTRTITQENYAVTKTEIVMLVR
jgi:hypothetical protein